MFSLPATYVMIRSGMEQLGVLDSNRPYRAALDRRSFHSLIDREMSFSIF